MLSPEYVYILPLYTIGPNDDIDLKNFPDKVWATGISRG